MAVIADMTELEAAPEIIHRPGLTAHSLLRRMWLQDSSVPTGIRHGITSLVGRELLTAYAPLRLSADPFFPEAMAPVVADTSHWVQEMATAVADADPAAVAERIHDQYAGRPPARWSAAAEDPRAWLGAVAGTLTAASPVLSVAWDRARARLDVEGPLIAAALRESAFPVVLGSLSRHVTVRDGELRMPYLRDVRPFAPPRRLRLAPMLSGPDAWSVTPDDADCLCLGYAVRGALPAVSQETYLPRRDPLVIVMGAARAQLLRALDRPRTVGALARTLDKAPSTVSHHCSRLRDAGLVETVSHAKQTWVVRTARGSALCGLLDR